MSVNAVFMSVLMAVWLALLCFYDVMYRRLPNFLTLPAWLLCLPWWSVGGSLWFLFYAGAYCVGAVRGRRFMGGGDVKLAFPLGVWVATQGGAFSVLAAIGVASFLTALQGLTCRSRYVAHGPSMVAASVIVCACCWLS